MATLGIDIRQLFAKTVLTNFERLDDADVQFTYKPGDVYMSSYAESISRLETSGFQESDSSLLTYAQVFERFVSNPIDIIDPVHAALASSCFYWLSGYSANAYVIASALKLVDKEIGASEDLLIRILSREVLSPDGQIAHDIYVNFLAHVTTGDPANLTRAIEICDDFESSHLESFDSNQFIVTYLLRKILQRLSITGFWASIEGKSSAPVEAWQRYVVSQIELGNPIIDLWPSQRAAIARGILDGESSLVMRMPTSSGKTKMTELAFVNDLFTYPERKCLYLAPYRALVNEVEGDIGANLNNLDIPIASLYGGAEANELEVELSNIARVIIATPEKIHAVHNLSGGSLSDFGTVVLDEGHLIDSISRGAAYELQLTRLRAEIAHSQRAIFISAVLPNSSEIASWLVGSSEGLAEDPWQPTTMRIGIVTWPTNRPARLSYLVQTGQPVTDGFFVPRLIEAEEWQEINPESGLLRTHRFPDRKDQGTIAAALGFQMAKLGPVIIYTSRPDWANGIAKKIVNRVSLERPIETNLVDATNEETLSLLADYVRRTLGEDSILSESIRLGVAIHHGGIPQGIRLVIEDEYRRGNIRMLIATNTIAQGVNFPAKAIIVHSFPRTDSPVRDFWNLAGRAGRALKETDGEVIILATGKLRPPTLRKFINIQNVEPVESRIMYLISSLLSEYPSVSEETINALLEDPEKGALFAEILRPIDVHLLEIMAEDVAIEVLDDEFKSLVENIFATHQATTHDLEFGTDYAEAIRDLLIQRREEVLDKVPEGNRKRYARSSISIETAITLDESIYRMIEIFDAFPEFTQEGLYRLFEVLCDAKELSGLEPESLASLSYSWITSGSYSSVFRLIDNYFRTYDHAVKFVEREMVYRLSWVINGAMRLLETSDEYILHNETGSIPSWFKMLPQFLRYGVQSQELVWVMSLGVLDKGYAEWLINIFNREVNRPPAFFREIVEWALSKRDELILLSSQEWPLYFARKFESILDRYSAIYEMLADQ